MLEAFPRLRNEIDAAPANRGEDVYYILYDRAGISASRLLVSPLGLLIAGRLDGSSSILDISDNLSREFGSSVSCQEIETIVAALDDAVFLEGVRFQDFQAQAARDFRSAVLRPASSAGSAYDDDPAKLAEELDRMLAEAPHPEEPCHTLSSPPKGIIIPHIDYMRGAPGYGQAYRTLAEAPAPKTVVVVGTAHLPLRNRYSLCEKAFDTPLGAVEVDVDLCQKLRQAVKPFCDIDADILAHRGEHSIELQAVWIRHVYGEDVRIVPLLAGSLQEFLEGERQPDEALNDPVFKAVAECLGDAVAGGGVAIMASADLSHVGPRFGDARDICNQYLAEVEEMDRKYLEAVSDSPLAGLESLASHGDQYHVCGSACIFTMGLALPGVNASLLGYHQAVTPEMRQAVTYASMLFSG